MTSGYPFMWRQRKSCFLQNEMASFWKAADINLVTDEVLKEQLEYGKI
jgi:thiosulfate dehydrogenase